MPYGGIAWSRLSPIALLAASQRGLCTGNYHLVNADQNITKSKK